MIKTLLKLAAKKLVPTVKFFATQVARVNKAVVNKATPYVINTISHGGKTISKVVTNPKAKVMIQTAAKSLANKKLVQAALHDVVFKTEKAIVKKVPLVGPKIGKVLDVADGIIGIPFI